MSVLTGMVQPPGEVDLQKNSCVKYSLCSGRISGLHCHAVSVLGWLLVLETGNRTEPCVWQEKQLYGEAVMQRRVLKGELLRALQNLRCELNLVAEQLSRTKYCCFKANGHQLLA